MLSVRSPSQHFRAMLYATLICTDADCGEELEGWGEAGDFDGLLCPSCGCELHALAFCEVHGGSVTELPRRTPYVQLRHAA